VWALFALEYIIKFWLVRSEVDPSRHICSTCSLLAVPFFRPLRMGRLIRLLRLTRVGVVLVENLRRPVPCRKSQYPAPKTASSKRYQQ
jgi:hypothetical protein